MQLTPSPTSFGAVAVDVAERISSVHDLESVYLYNIDPLSEIAQLNLQQRHNEAQACEEMVAAETAETLSRFEPPPLAPSQPLPVWGPSFAPSIIRAA